jgi:nitric oxide reductase NorD protein
MPTDKFSEKLTNRLADELGPATAASLVERMVESGSPPSAILALLNELEEVSPKAARGAIDALSELDRRAGFSQIVSWLDLGVALAESSGATALKYFKDSPLILGVIEPADSQAVALAVGLELAEQDANVTLEFLKVAPQVLPLIPPAQLVAWLDIGVELMRVDLVVGLEYIRQIPALAVVLPLSELRRWLSFGMKLTRPNTLGKPDYLATIEFLRTSPSILGDIEQAPLRSPVVSLGALLAEQAPEAGIAWLAESPTLLRALPSAEWQRKMLQYGSLLAEKDAEAALSYLRRSSEIVGMIGEGLEAFSRFENWFKAGMEVLAYSPEGARAYFEMESQKALSSVEQALSGVPLRQVARKIKLFIQGLCGSEVSIAALSNSLAMPLVRPRVTADGKTIALPALLRQFPTADQNERLYLVMAAHEAGHLEFGTYRLTLSSLKDLIESVRLRYGQSTGMMPDSLAGLFRMYPHPRLIHDLWSILEDARVEFLLQTEYPGLKRDLAQFAAEAIIPRDPAHGLTVKELIVDCILRLSSGESESTAIPQAVKEEVSTLWKLCQPILSASATAETTVRLTHELYVRMEDLLAPRASMIPTERPKEDSQEIGVGPTASEQGTDEYRPVTNWVYRGEMNPEFIRQDDDGADERRSELERIASQGGGSKERSGTGPGGRRSEEEFTIGDVLGGGRALPPVVEELLALDMEQQPAAEPSDQGDRAVRYPEWDHTIQDYRMHWCRVVEREAEPGADEFVSATLTSHQSVIRSLRRFFESLRPPAFRRIAGQADGEDLDIDAVVRRAAEQQAGIEGGDRIYIRREKRERNVAVAFLIDVSGSTGRQIESGRRVIDVEKEGLVLLCEALDAVGDQYALYAYSGQGRHSVEMLTIKNFDERLGVTTAQRLGGLGPRQQNRDGAAIRHAVAKLRTRDVKTRILVLLSDGRPLDGDYKDEYALEDTRVALREARRQGIDPFCVTIDREADSYLRRMYGDVQYTVIDRIESLPTRLPWIYQRLAT